MIAESGLPRSGNLRSIALHGEQLSKEKANELLQLSRLGKLCGVERWIAEGNSLMVPPETRTSPLLLLVEVGFHRLVLLIARNLDCRDTKNSALAKATSLHRIDLVELLIAIPAEFSGAHLGPCCNWSPQRVVAQSPVFRATPVHRRSCQFNSWTATGPGPLGNDI